MAVTIDLNGKRALVTGGNRGIGRTISERLADAGADVAVFARNEQSVAEAARALSGRGVRGLPLVGDVGSDADVERAWDTLMKEFGQLDILVNNAGITRDGLLLRMKPEDWHAVLDVNLTGAFRWCRLAAKQMLRQRSGTIINISSIVGVIGNPGQTNYAASKAGLIGFSKSLAVEVAARGITVNVIAPGFIETEMTHVLGEEAQAEFLSRIPLGKLGTTGDVADLTVFLASPMSDYITGQVICVDGGLTR
ncbi:MAG TPA: 3-oxoacyl-[acyl-carrier-protein] reductase [Gemmatimonadota bacterium]|nr:3-oxoacyl-[acyl-carrier-protein] reductase [Gemmatimonadota bacterium]